MVNIVSFVAFCILGAALVQAEFNKEEAIKEVSKYVDDCTTEVGATPADMDELKNEKPASTKEGKCMRACLMKKFNVMTDDGKFSREGALHKAEIATEGDPETMKLVNEIIDQCFGASTSSDHCEAAEEYTLCFKAQLTQRGIQTH